MFSLGKNAPLLTTRDTVNSVVVLVVVLVVAYLVTNNCNVTRRLRSLFFLAQFFFNKSLQFVSVTVNTALSSVAPALTYVLGICRGLENQ